MKSAALILCMILTSLAYAESKLVVPLFIRDGKSYISVKLINQKYSLTGPDKIAEYIVIENHEYSFNKAYDDVSNEIPENVEKLNKKIKKDFSLVIGKYPGELDRKEAMTCFKGNSVEVIDILEGVAGVLYRDDLVYVGWRIREKIVVAPFFVSRFSSASHANRFLSQNLTLWSQWSENPMKPTSVLFATAYEDNLLKVSQTQINLCN